MACQWRSERAMCGRVVQKTPHQRDAETIASKPAFRDAFARGQRCIVPVDAFYEWQKVGTAKQPYAIVSADGLPLAMAGLWERWSYRGTGFDGPDVHHHHN